MGFRDAIPTECFDLEAAIDAAPVTRQRETGTAAAAICIGRAMQIFVPRTDNDLPSDDDFSADIATTCSLLKTFLWSSAAANTAAVAVFVWFQNAVPALGQRLQLTGLAAAIFPHRHACPVIVRSRCPVRTGTEIAEGIEIIETAVVPGHFPIGINAPPSIITLLSCIHGVIPADAGAKRETALQRTGLGASVSAHRPSILIDIVILTRLAGINAIVAAKLERAAP